MLHILDFKYIANMLQKLVCYLKLEKKIKTLQCPYVNMGTITE